MAEHSHADYVDCYDGGQCCHGNYPESIVAFGWTTGVASSVATKLLRCHCFF